MIFQAQSSKTHSVTQLHQAGFPVSHPQQLSTPGDDALILMLLKNAAAAVAEDLQVRIRNKACDWALELWNTTAVTEDFCNVRFFFFFHYTISA
jgi:hypothetical protein